MPFTTGLPLRLFPFHQVPCSFQKILFLTLCLLKSFPSPLASQCHLFLPALLVLVPALILHPSCTLHHQPLPAPNMGNKGIEHVGVFVFPPRRVVQTLPPHLCEAFTREGTSAGKCGVTSEIPEILMARSGGNDLRLPWLVQAGTSFSLGWGSDSLCSVMAASTFPLTIGSAVRNQIHSCPGGWNEQEIIYASLFR